MTPPQEDRPLTLNEMRALLARAKDPRALYLNVFEGPAGPEFENAHRVHMDRSTQEPFTSGDDQPATIKVFGTSSLPLTALLDPSTPESWASLEMKQELPLVPLGPPHYQVQAAHLADTKGGFLAYASAIKLDTLSVDSALFTIRNNTGGLGPFARDVTTPSEEDALQAPVTRWSSLVGGDRNSNIDLVLGHQFLQAFSFVRLDYPDQTVSFSTTRAFPTPGAKLLVRLPLLTIQGALGTEALVNGKPTKVLLDLAGNYSAALSENSDTKELSIYLGDLSLRNLTPVSYDTLGLTQVDYPRVGWQSLRQFVITLDYQRQVIWFERP